VDKPLFVLIGGYTYSAAEEFAYNLKALNRATLVGNQTGGGAHPTRSYKIDEDFAISIPFARAINPVTGTNWEGVGVEPDIEVHPEGFMAGRTIAHLQALKVIELTIEDDGYRQSIRLLIDELQTEVDSYSAE